MTGKTAIIETCSGGNLRIDTPPGELMTGARAQPGTSRDTFTRGRGVTYTGLLEKCPAIAYYDRTVAIDDDFTGVSMRRRTNAYTFDQDLYHQWQMGGICLD